MIEVKKLDERTYKTYSNFTEVLISVTISDDFMNEKEIHIIIRKDNDEKRNKQVEISRVPSFLFTCHEVGLYDAELML